MEDAPKRYACIFLLYKVDGRYYEEKYLSITAKLFPAFETEDRLPRSKGIDCFSLTVLVAGETVFPTCDGNKYPPCAHSTS
jgi:hypothetical protein